MKPRYMLWKHETWRKKYNDEAEIMKEMVKVQY